MQTNFLHMVYFWLREGGDAGDAERLMNGCRTHLTKIPTVLRLAFGLPTATTRDVVDNSYGVAVVVEFADKAGYEVYETHPDHLQFIEECHALWSKVQVYDSILQFDSTGG